MVQPDDRLGARSRTGSLGVAENLPAFRFQSDSFSVGYSFVVDDTFIFESELLLEVEERRVRRWSFKRISAYMRAEVFPELRRSVRTYNAHRVLQTRLIMEHTPQAERQLRLLNFHRYMRVHVHPQLRQVMVMKPPPLVRQYGRLRLATAAQPTAADWKFAVYSVVFAPVLEEFFKAGIMTDLFGARVGGFLFGVAELCNRPQKTLLSFVPLVLHWAVMYIDHIGWRVFVHFVYNLVAHLLVLVAARYYVPAATMRTAAGVNARNLVRAARESSRGVDLGGGGGRGVRSSERAASAITSVPPPSGTVAVLKEFVVVRSGVPFAYSGQFLDVYSGLAEYKSHRGYVTAGDESVARYMGIPVLGTVHTFCSAQAFVGCDGAVERSTVLEGTCMPGYVNDCGTYKPSDKHSGRMAVFPFVLVEDDGWVFKPALYRVVKGYGACLPSESVLRTITRELTQTYPTLPAEMVGSVIRVFRRIALRMNEVAMGPTRCTPPAIKTSRFVERAGVMGACVQYGLWKLKYQTSDLRPSVNVHERRDILDVVEVVGGSFVDGQLEWVTPCSMPHKEVLVAVQFTGPTRFTYFSSNSANQAASLVRVFKPRGGSLAEDNLATRRQLTFLFDTFECDSPIFLKMGRAQLEVGRRFESVTFTNAKPYRKMERLDDVHHLPIRGWYTQIMSEYMEGISFLSVLTWLSKVFGVGGGLFTALRDFRRIFCEYGLRLGLGVISVAGLAFLWFGDVITFRYFHGHLPHAKSAIRRSLARARFGELRPAHVGFVKEIEAQVKDEPAKPGKPPRLYFSLGLLSPLFGGAWIDAVKKSLFEPRIVRRDAFELETQFVGDNSAATVASYFDKAWSVRSGVMPRIYALIMSDDVKVDTPTGSYDLDISMCDASLGLGLFWVAWLFLRACMVPEEVIQGLLSQVSQRVRTSNPNDKKEYIIWRFITYYLVSGTVLTTLVDTLASFMVVAAFAAAYTSGVREAVDFTEWFAAVGLCVTVEFYDRFEQSTMLKRHPMRLESGVIAAPLALGCLLKRFGLIDTDISKIPGLTLEDRCATFLGGVVESWKGEPGHPLLDVLRERFPVRHGFTVLNEDERLTKDLSHERVDLESLLACYGASLGEYYEAVEIAKELQIGSIAQCAFLQKVFAKDYGL